MATQLDQSEIASLVAKHVTRVAELRLYALERQDAARHAAQLVSEALDKYRYEERLLAGYRALLAERDVSLTSVHGFTYPSALKAFQFFHDSSWGNDSTDSVAFAIGNTAVTVWIDHMIPECRISDAMETRFAVCRLCDGDPSRQFSEQSPTLREMVNERNLADEPPLLETDDPEVLMAFLREMAEREMAACLAESR